MTVPYIFANSSGTVQLVELDVNFAYVNNNVNTANTVVSSSQPSITSLGTLTSITVNGPVTATANISGNYFYGNGFYLSGIANAYSNADVAAYLLSFNGNMSANNMSANTLTLLHDFTGHGNITLSNNTTITATYLAGDGSNITGVPGANYGNSNVALYLSSGNANSDIITSGNVNSLSYTGNTITTDAIIGSANTISITANLLPTTSDVFTLGNTTETWNALFLGNAGITLGDQTIINNTSNVEISGNVVAPYFVGDGSLLTNLPPLNYNDSNVTTLLSSGNVTTDIITTGNITGNYFIGDGSQLVNLPGVTYGDSNVTTLLASGNIATDITTTGNVTGNYILGDGSLLTGLPATYGDANVAAYLPTYTGNLTNVVIKTNSYYYANGVPFAGSGNVVITNFAAGNIGEIQYNNGSNGFAATDAFTVDGTSGTLSVTGNITTAGYFIGNGSQLTDIVSTYGDSNVTTLLSSGAYTANIETSGTVISANVAPTVALQLPVYADATARDAAITRLAATAGMLVFVIGSGFQGFDGNAWGNITLS